MISPSDLAAAITAADNPAFPLRPEELYTADDLADGFATGGYDGMFDTVVHRYFWTHDGPRPPFGFAVAQLLHDSAMDRLLAATVEAWTASGRGPVVAIMGGHALRRNTAEFRQAVSLGQELARAGCLIVTGGGPGVMEAANLGAMMMDRRADELSEAVDTLAACPKFEEHQKYTDSSVRVRARFRRPHGDAELNGLLRGGLAIATWNNEDIPQPANLFAARTAKYLSDPLPEEKTLAICRGRSVFASGRAGTVQEVFQAVTKIYYASDGTGGPVVFLGSRFWTDTVPVVPLAQALLRETKAGDLSGRVAVTDDVAEAVAAVSSR